MYIYMYSRGHWTRASWCIYKAEHCLQVVWLVLSGDKEFQFTQAAHTKYIHGILHDSCSVLWGIAGLRHFSYFVLNKTFFYSSYRFIWYGMRQRRDMSSMFWLRWIHHFLSSIGNVDLWAIGSSDSVFQDYKLEKGRWTHPFLVVFPGKTTDNWRIHHSLGVENTLYIYCEPIKRWGLSPLFIFYFYLFKKKKSLQWYPISSIILSFLAKVVLCCWGMGVRLRSWISSSQFLFT